MKIPKVLHHATQFSIYLIILAALLLVGCGNGEGSGGASPSFPAPPATALSPANGETNVSEYAVVEIVFDRDMEPASLNEQSFLLLDPAGNPVSATVSYRRQPGFFGVLNIAMLFHAGLAPATRYTARLTTAVKDASGQALSANYDWSFTTRPDSGIGTWQSMASSGLTGRKPAVWTGSKMIVWGTSGGASYDPASNTWTSIATLNAPSTRTGHTLIWTGQRIIAWGGIDSGGTALGDGGSYDPFTDTWQPLSASAQVSARAGHSAVWTGSRMLVWGGYVPGTDPLTQLPTLFAQNTGALYDPVTNTWQAVNATNAPSRRYEHTAVWTGSRMIVWGGYGGDALPFDYTELNNGASYDPVTDSWQTLSNNSSPQSRKLHTALWTGSRMMVWGGFHLTAPGYYLNSGGLYDPLTDSWTSTSATGAPDPRDSHAAVWTGSEAIVWGGEVGVDLRYLLGARHVTCVETGGRYNPAADTWAPTSITSTPSCSLGWLPPSAVWTGNEMVIWTGNSIGGRYTP